MKNPRTFGGITPLAAVLTVLLAAGGTNVASAATPVKTSGSLKLEMTSAAVKKASFDREKKGKKKKKKKIHCEGLGG